MPGVYAGAHVSSRAPDGLIRPVLIVVLAASGMKLLKASNAVVVAFLLLAGAFAAINAYRRRGQTGAVPSAVAGTVAGQWQR